MYKKNLKVGTSNYKKKDISNAMIREIKKFQKYLQLKENIKYGKKAKYVSFIYATKKPKELAKFIMGDRK